MAFRPRNTLNLALCAALSARRADVLRYLFIGHGPSPFAIAIAARRIRQVADAISLLAPDQRAAVVRNLPTEIRARLVTAGMLLFDPSASSHQKPNLSTANDGLLSRAVRSWASAPSMNSQNTKATA